MWPQVVILGLIIWRFVYRCTIVQYYHYDPFDRWTEVSASAVAWLLVVAILWAGGFWVPVFRWFTP